MRIDDLTCCRAAFAGWVYAYHLNLHVGGKTGWLGAIVSRGYLGVDGFFILSGLVLGIAHPAQALDWPSLRAFWIRRLARIYPVHLAMIVLLAVLLAVSALADVRPNQPERFGADELVRNLLLLQGWGFSDRWAWIYPSWSISTEWAGYLAFPLLWLAVRRLPAWSRTPMLVAMFALLLAVDAAAGPVGLNLTYAGALRRFFPEFVAGMVICSFTGGLPGRVLVGLGAAVLALAVPFGSDPIIVLGLGLILFGLTQAARQGAAPLVAGVPGLVWLGVLSYAFYMSFAPAETIAAFAWRRLGVAPVEHPAVYVVTSTALTFAIAIAAWRFVERPAQRAVVKRFAATSPAPALAPTRPPTTV
jgi:peptidoglycan/LPS O-acetylase OafA/YrhL